MRKKGLTGNAWVFTQAFLGITPLTTSELSERKEEQGKKPLAPGKNEK
jgi:hypothetical protein